MKKVDLSKYDNSWYKPGNILLRVIWYYVNICFFKNSFFTSSNFKVLILRLFGANVGKNLIIKNNVNIKYPWKLTIGDNCWIGEEVWIDNLDYVFIYNNVCISQGAMLLCGNHNYKKYTFDLITSPISLMDGTWVGAKSIVCPGVTLFQNSILTAGSLANQDLEANYIYQGNPAKKNKLRQIN